ncbi:polyprenyl synthetase family protein [Lichenihabitans psoromatis]|uniref:polyprenyl synthetase family protein n=1 Tax=Lichenihabitans psoromatis TaxID=2528642 RepID=UPI00103856DF|nr:polyprenyl synthetase family protein [Lichenihabitans psoromatis]
MSRQLEDCLLRVDQTMDDLAGPVAHDDDLPPFHGDDAAAYHLRSGGQRMRARLGVHASLSLGVAEADAVAIGAAVELLHNASLIHDDLQDRDRTRRGHDAVWSRYGSNVAICTGDLLISAAFASIASLTIGTSVPAAVRVMHRSVASAIRGQGADLSFEARSLSDAATYDAIAFAKSGVLLSLPLELAFVVAGRHDLCGLARQAAGAFAIGYQIADDIADADRDRSLNLVSVLTAAGVSDPLGAARRRAQDRLATGRHLALALPDGSGALLVALCDRLSTSLIGESAMVCGRS